MLIICVFRITALSIPEHSREGLARWGGPIASERTRFLALDTLRIYRGSRRALGELL
jgi:hypothetical protein